MALIEKHVAINIDSNFGQNPSSDGHEFDYVFSPALMIPEEAVDCELKVVEASLVYVWPNLSVTGTDQFIYRRNGTTHTHDIPRGIYSLQGLQDFMNACALSDGIALENDMFVLDGIVATQKVQIGAYMTGGHDVKIRFQDAGMANVAALLGFDTEEVDFSGPNGGYQFAMGDNRALFSDLQYVTIQSTLVEGAYDPRGNQSNVLCEIPPDVNPGESIYFRPSFPMVCDATNLIGSPVHRVHFKLIDNLGRPVDTMGESWSARIKISYKIFVGGNE